MSLRINYKFYTGNERGFYDRSTGVKYALSRLTDVCNMTLAQKTFVEYQAPTPFIDIILNLNKDI